MKFRTKPTLEAIDALCQRECCFAICREAGAKVDDFFMAHDGKFWYHHHPLDLAGKSGFLISPYQLLDLPLFIPEELDHIPYAGKYPTITKKRCFNRASSDIRQEYSAQFRKIQQLIAETNLEKQVLARTEDMATPHFSPARAYARACRLYPNAFCTLFHLGAYGTWICCTPELLIKGQNHDWTSMSLAGTQAKGCEWSEKNKREQIWVSKHTRETLEYLRVPYTEDETCTLNAGPIEHLCTRFHIKMPSIMLYEFLDEFPPTPAVCGYPTDIARHYQDLYPDIEREFYAGFVGPYHHAQHCALYVTLRCMQVGDDSCRLYAGGGILAESNEESEWQETCLKMQAMRTLIEEQQASR